MVQTEVIRSKLESIREMLAILRRHQKKSLEDFLADRDSQLAVEHALLVAIQSLLDLGSHLLADREVRNISDYRDVILKLGQVKILPAFFSESIAEMAGFRNRLIHEYQEIDPRKVHQFLQARLQDFEDFIRYIRDHFRLS